VIDVMRGGIVESRHRVHVAVSDARGARVATTGDPGMFVFYRSAAKPQQALPLVEEGVVERFGLTNQELALCCASHEGEPRHVEGVRSILAKAGVEEAALRCGTQAPYSEDLGVLAHWRRPVLRNARQEGVGEMRAGFGLTWA